MKSRPLHDNIYVEAVFKEKTDGGIYLPDASHKTNAKLDGMITGNVVAVGPGKKDPRTGQRKPMDIKVGDNVFYSKHAKDTVKIDGKDVYVIKEADIAGVFEKGI